VRRGDIWDAVLPAGRRPAVVVTRDRAIPLLRNVTVVAVTGTVRDLPTEVLLGPAQGLARECVANCDNIFTIPKRSLDRHRGMLGPAERRRLDDALRVALALD
jgi:mRNA interferase MazF